MLYSLQLIKTGKLVLSQIGFLAILLDIYLESKDRTWSMTVT